MSDDRKTALITGCSSGIGYASAHGLRERGWRVFASCRKAADCERLRAEGFESPLIDYADEAGIESAVAEVAAATGGRLDALFNNGAWALPCALEDAPRNGMRAIFEANLFGWHDLTRRVLPMMRAQGHGRIVQCSSILGLVALKFRGPYNATKFALEGLSDTLRLELRGTGVHVILIEPGPIGTAFRDNAYAQFKRWIDRDASVWADRYAQMEKRFAGRNTPDRFELPPEAVVEKLIHALESPRPRIRYHVTIPTRVASAARRLLPTRILDYFQNKAS